MWLNNIEEKTTRTGTETAGQRETNKTKVSRENRGTN